MSRLRFGLKNNICRLLVCTAFLSSVAIAADKSLLSAKQEFDRGNYDKTLSLLSNKTDLDALVLRNRALRKFFINDNHCLIEACDKYPGRYNLFVGMAMTEIDRRSYAKAQVWLEKALRLSTNDSQVVAMSGLCKIRTGAEQDGLKELSRSVKLNENDEVVLQMNAAAYDSLLKTDLAEQYYRKLCDRFSKHPYDWVLKGQFLERLGKKKESLDCYGKAIALNSRFEEGYSARAKFYFRQSDFKSAIDDASKCIALKFGGEQEIDCLRIRASCYIAQKMPQKAIEDLKSYLALNKAGMDANVSGPQDAYLDMAEAYITLRQFASAQECLARLKKSNLRGADVLEQEARIANLKGNYVEALRDYEKLREQEGDDPALLKTIEKLKLTIDKSKRVDSHSLQR